MDLVRLGHLQDYWEKCPPVHVAVAGYLGYGKDDDNKNQQPQQLTDTPAAIFDAFSESANPEAPPV